MKQSNIMLAFFFLGLLSLCFLASANGDVCAAPTPKPVRVIRKAAPKPEQKPSVTDVRQESATTVQTSDQANNQTVNLTIGSSMGRVKTKVRLVDVSLKNQVFFLVGVTQVERVTRTCCTLSVSKEQDIDIGFQYVRNVGGVMVTGLGTINKSFFVGLGFGW